MQRRQRIEELARTLLEDYGGNEEKWNQALQELDFSELAALKQTIVELAGGVCKKESWWSRFFRQCIRNVDL